MPLTEEDRKKNALIGNVNRYLNAIKKEGKEETFYEFISKEELAEKPIGEQLSMVKDFCQKNDIKLPRVIKDKKDNDTERNVSESNLNLNLDELLSYLPADEDDDTNGVKIIRYFAKVSKAKKELDDLKLQYKEKENEYNMLVTQLDELKKNSDK